MHASTSQVARPEARSKPHLLRILGVGFGIAAIVGNSVGTGILLTPGQVAAQLRNPWIVFAAWSMGGLFAFFCTQSVTELGTMLPQAGGWFVYSRRAFGEYGGFLVACCDCVMQSAGNAYLAAACGEFTVELVPALQGRATQVAVAFLVVLMLLNWLGLRAGSRAQQITSLIKTVGLLALVAACFLLPPKADVVAPAAPRSLLLLPSAAILVAVIVALQSIIATYDGWYSAIYFTEEDEDPARNLPRSSIAGVLACVAIFLLVNAALFRALPMGWLAASHMPVADAAAIIFGAHGRVAILLLSLITVISSMNVGLLIMPRILFAMARDRLIPGWITFVNSGGTPVYALLLSTAAAVSLVLSGSFLTLIAISAILFVAVYLSGFISLFVLRVREPDLPRPFKMWGYPWTNLGITLGAAGFLVAAVIADLKHALFTVITIAITYPLYLLVKAMRRSQNASLTPVPLAIDQNE
jgi:APA family basic amino acid/polyamine antiporter